MSESDQQQVPDGVARPPTGLVPMVFSGFSTLYTNSSRPGIEDQQLFWCDGFMPVGNNFLRTLPGVGDPIFTAAPGTVPFFDFFNIGATPYMVVVLATGEIFVVNTDTGVQTGIAGVGTIINPSRDSVGISSWGATYLLIVANQPDGYFLWDGTTFYKAGDTVPGMGTMPTGVSGTALETYQSRVWVLNGPIVTFSSPGSVTDFSTGSGGGSFTSNDSFLRVQFVKPVQSNGFLYLIADSSINYISGVQTTGSPPVTTFTNQNADPETGTPYPATIDVLSSNIVFANAFGAHVSYGGRVQKVSEALDGIYSTVPNFGGFIPSATKAIIFGKRVWALLIPVIDTVTGQQVNRLMMWDGGKRWWTSGQDINLIYVQHQEINSVLTAWGTDGASIYPLFVRPTSGFTKRFQTKLKPSPDGYMMTITAARLWGVVQINSILDPALTISIDNEAVGSSMSVTVNPVAMDWSNNVGATMVWTNNLAQPLLWYAAGTGLSVFGPEAVAQQGKLLGLTVSTDAADDAVISLTLGSVPWSYNG